MSQAGFETLSAVTIGELGLGIMLLRDGSLGIDKLADAFSGHFRADVSNADVRTLYTRMVERHWISSDAAVPGGICVTRDGHDLLLAAFTALIRLVDEGHGALEISLLFSLASKRLSHEDDD